MFIGGDVPHWVKKFVNRLESSSNQKSKIALNDDGFCATKKINLTEDHFYKNAYSRMRVHLAVQVVSQSVVCLIDKYEEEKEFVSKYASLRDIVLACDRFVDIQCKLIKRL